MSKTHAYSAHLSVRRIEYDAEEVYIRNGNRATSVEDFGGRIKQRIHLGISKNGAFKFTLQQPVKSKSNRFARFLGSRRLIECYFSRDDAQTHGKDIISFFAHKKLLINGRLFQAFYGHEHKVQLMEIREDFGRKPQEVLGDLNRISWMEMVNWHNNLEFNSAQALNKWVSRFALGFSISQPGLVFQPHNIHFLDDICGLFEAYLNGSTYKFVDAPGENRKSAMPHQIMTDGCGFLNYAALKAIQINMAWETFPTCVQARIAGSKGIFLLHPSQRDQNEEPQVWMG